MDRLFILTILVLPILGSILGWFIGRKSEKYRDTFNIVLTGTEFMIVTLLYKSVVLSPIKVFIPDIMGTGLWLKLDVFRYVFVWITAFIWFLTTVYSTQYLIRYKNRNRYYAFFMLTLGSTIGIFLSENLLNLFTFFEIMSLTSYMLVIHDEDQYSHEAGRAYISMAITGGLVLLMGLFLLFDYTGTLDITMLAATVRYLGNIKYIIAALIIVGFGVKASMVPLHVWLPKTYPAAPTPATAVLSGILVKTGLFGIMILVNVIMEGDVILSTIMVVAGLLNMFIGGFLAIFQRNIKRVLAYSSMSQVGYILLGIGLIGLLEEHNTLAVYGTLYHIVNHAIFKVLLFLCAGIIYMVLKELSINVIRGFGKHKNVLKVIFIIGFLGTIGMPGFNGFISKTLIHESLLEAAHLSHSPWFTIAEIVFTISSSFTVAYLTKIFVSVFMEKSEKYWGQYKHHLKKRAIIPMMVLSIIVIYIGIKPNVLLHVFDEAQDVFNAQENVEIHFYTKTNIKNSLLVIAYGLIIYFGFIRSFLRREGEEGPIYINPSLKWFSLENDLYIPVGTFLYRFSSAFFHIVDRGIINMVDYTINGIKAISGIKVKKPQIMTKKIKIKKRETSNTLTKTPKILNKKEEIQKNVKTELITLSDILTGTRNKLNSIVYAVFIFAIMIIIILAVLVFNI
jgi:formate hydrogenlyase subunit 3/multisubunit Na+/H+ antiporter MnhD subunit